MPTPTPTEGDDNLTNSQANDTINALGGNDTINVELIQGVLASADVDGGPGSDTLRTGLQNGFGFFTSLTPSSYIVRYDSNTYLDVTYVNVEALTLIGSWGSNDPLATGDTHDSITFTRSGGAQVQFNSGGGNDTIVLSGLHFGGSIDLGTGNDSLDISAASITPNLTFILAGGAGDDAMIGGSSMDYMYGGIGADTLSGGTNNDQLDGGEGVDLMAGGLGNDRFFVDAGDVVAELNGEGSDIVYARTSYTLTADAYIELLAAIDGSSPDPIHLNGNQLDNLIQGNAGSNRLFGDAGSDYLVGLGGLDVLDGGWGVDTLEGGLGNDRYYVDTGDVVLERTGEGTDIVYATRHYVLNAGAHVELLAAASGSAANHINLTGNELNNTIQGDTGANALFGAAGDDYLSGFSGNDLLEGGLGRDILEGGAGLDTFRFAALGDSPTGGGGDKILDFLSGTDRINLLLIDANSNVAGDQAFTFIGANAFTSTAGQLRASVIGSQTHLLGDVNGDSVPDLHIIVNSTTIVASDFVL